MYYHKNLHKVAWENLLGGSYKTPFYFYSFSALSLKGLS